MGKVDDEKPYGGWTEEEALEVRNWMYARLMEVKALAVAGSIHEKGCSLTFWLGDELGDVGQYVDIDLRPHKEKVDQKTP